MDEYLALTGRARLVVHRLIHFFGRQEDALWVPFLGPSARCPFLTPFLVGRVPLLK